MQFRPLTANLLLVAREQNIPPEKADITNSNSEEENETFLPAGQGGSQEQPIEPSTFNLQLSTLNLQLQTLNLNQ
jgi:hypothetical protein